MRTILLSLAMLAAGATAANADINVWWQLDGSNCGAEAVDQGTGKMLMIGTPMFAPVGFYEYELSMWIATDGAGGTTNGCTGHRNTLWRGPDTTLTMQNEPLDGLLNPLNWTGLSGYDNQNNGNKLIGNWGRARALGQPVIGGTTNNNLKMLSMTLRVDRPAMEWCEWIWIYQTVGSSLYGHLPSAGNRVFFGPNTWVYGNTAVDTWAEACQTLPVVGIHVDPAEPASLALLGLGVLMVVRRRRSGRSA